MSAEDYHWDFYDPPELEDDIREFETPKRFPKPNALGLTTLPNRNYMAPKNQSKKRPFLHKYYVGAKHVAESISVGKNDQWAHATVENAVKHGMKLMETEDRDCVIVVKIVKILRRKPMPIEVESV